MSRLLTRLPEPSKDYAGKRGEKCIRVLSAPSDDVVALTVASGRDTKARPSPFAFRCDIVGLADVETRERKHLQRMRPATRHCSWQGSTQRLGGDVIAGLKVNHSADVREDAIHGLLGITLVAALRERII